MHTSATLDPALKATSASRSFRTIKDKDGNWVDKPDFHRVKAFGTTGTFALKHLEKGRLVGISGNIQQSSYEKDGKTRYETALLAGELRPFGPRSKSPDDTEEMES